MKGLHAAAAIWLVLLLPYGVLMDYYDCPASCICDYRIQEVRCNDIFNMSWTQFYQDLPSGVETLSIRGGAISKIPRPPHSVSSFMGLLKLTVDDCGVTAIQPGAFKLMPSLLELNIVHNNISKINASHFAGLNSLQVLNISHSGLQHIHDKTFDNFTSLEVLDLSHNGLINIPSMTSLEQVRKIDLSYSHIQYIHPNTFSNLATLEVLDLCGNELDTLHSATLANVTVQEIFLAGNHWDCHCGIEWLVQEMQLSDSFKDIDNITCSAPNKYRGQKVVNLDPAELQCETPSVVDISANQSIQYLHSTLLECNVSGQASVYWHTPRGVLVHPDHRRWLPPHITEYAHRLTYSGKPTHWEASIEALDNGSLYVHNFRVFFAGEYTCVAENPEGSDSLSLVLSIYSVMNTVMEVSTLLGYSMAMACLVAGIIIGATRMCAERHCKCCKPKQKPPSIEDKDAMNASAANMPPNDDVFNEKHWSNFGAYQYEYDPTLRSPSLSPRMSPMKCVTPAEYTDDYDDDDVAPPHLTDDIKELLILVRASLRHGLETGTEHMRTVMRDNAAVEHMRERAQTLRQNIRETGSNLRESSTLTLARWRSNSSHAASRARTGVTVGLEQVKSHVQSMKELCGTSADPGGANTVSVVSIETDVDNSESKEVVKSVTML